MGDKEDLIADLSADNATLKNQERTLKAKITSLKNKMRERETRW